MCVANSPLKMVLDAYTFCSKLGGRSANLCRLLGTVGGRVGVVASPGFPLFSHRFLRFSPDASFDLRVLSLLASTYGSVRPCVS